MCKQSFLSNKPLHISFILVLILPLLSELTAFIQKTKLIKNDNTVIGNLDSIFHPKNNIQKAFFKPNSSGRLIWRVKDKNSRGRSHFVSTEEDHDVLSDEDKSEPWVLRAMTLKNLDHTTEPQLLSDFLLELGACSIAITDHDRGTPLERPIFNEPDQNDIDTAAIVWEDAAVGMNVWPRCDVTAHFPASIDLAEVADAVRYTFGMPTTPRYEVDEIPDLDWVKHVQSSWKPFVCGQGARTFILKFPWHGDEDAKEALLLHNSQHQLGKGEEKSSDPNDYLGINLEGGIAFGTGEHPTTQLCLGWISDLFVDNDVKMFLDYGAGSGVLGIAACLCSEEVRSIGVEIDADAIRIANANSKRNNANMQSFLPGKLDEDIESASVIMKARARTDEKSLPNDLDGAIYDACAANILAGPLIGLVEGIASMIKPGGKLGLSGILKYQANDVVEAYSNFFDDVQVAKELEGWVLITGTRKIS